MNQREKDALDHYLTTPPEPDGWVINLKETDLYWSNEQGWVDIDSATTFSDDEKLRVFSLPINGEWEKI